MATLESNVGVVQENLESCTRKPLARPLAKKTQENPGRAGLFFTPGVSHLNQVLIVSLARAILLRLFCSREHSKLDCHLAGQKYLVTNRKYKNLKESAKLDRHHAGQQFLIDNKQKTQKIETKNPGKLKK